VRLVNVVAKSNHNEEDKHGNQRIEELGEATVRMMIIAGNVTQPTLGCARVARGCWT
jgi:hypothetical protein